MMSRQPSATQMKPVHPRVIDLLRFAGLALGAIVAAAAIYQYMKYSGRPDAAEVRDLWLIVAMELAAMPIALSFLMPRAEADSLAELAPTPAPRVPNPWAY
jgi:hypothetical protein